MTARGRPANPGLGPTIRRLRGEAGLSLRALEAHSGLSRGGLSHTERDLNVPTLETVRVLARALDRSVPALLREWDRDRLPAAEVGLSFVFDGGGRVLLFERGRSETYQTFEAEFRGGPPERAWEGHPQLSQHAVLSQLTWDPVLTYAPRRGPRTYVRRCVARGGVFDALRAGGTFYDADRLPPVPAPYPLLIPLAAAARTGATGRLVLTEENW